LTTIIAKEYFGDVAFASDTQSTAGARATAGRTKVFANGSVVFGVAGACRVSDILRFAELPQIPVGLKGVRLERWLITELVPAVQKELTNSGALENDNGEVSSNYEALLAVNGRLFTLGSDFALIGNARFAAIGSGSSYALGALRAGATPKDAVRIAAEFDVYTGAKVIEYSAERLMK